MIEEIKTELKKESEVIAWQIVKTNRRSSQLYATAYIPESVREVEQESYSVSLMVGKEDKEWIGESSFTLISGQNVQEEVKAAVERARYVKNKSYTFPLPDENNGYESRQIRSDALKVVEKVKKDYEKVKNLQGVKLSYYEIFVNNSQLQIVNSNGLTVGEQTSDIFTEFVLLSADEKHEIYHSLKSRGYETLNLLEAIHDTAEMVRNTSLTQLAPTGKYNVLFSGETLDTLFNYFVSQSDAAGIYSGWSIFKEGETVIENPQGEMLDIESDPTLPSMIGSTRFDGNGVTRKKVALIHKNVFSGITATQKYACYTGKEATGPVGNIVVTAGNKSLDEIRKGKYLEVLQFSTFEPNYITGAFSGEIRFAKLFDEEGNVSYIKGGSVSGKMLDAFKNASLSREITHHESYVGPKGVLLENISVAGEEAM
ncbi:MAG: hypothetical protein HQK84_07005 [Nitrospinae bacterium]|nr:hypothetical protein [Nitrospinota bacterium]